MISLKQMTQLAASSTEVWRILQLEPAKSMVVNQGELKSGEDRPLLQLQRDRKLLWDLTFRLKITLEDEGASAALKARMLVDGARKLETFDLKLLVAPQDINRHAQLVRDYQIAFDSLCLTLGEDGTQTLFEVFHYPEHIIALAEYRQLRREPTGLELRSAVLDKIIVDAQEDTQEAEQDGACAQAFWGQRKAQNYTYMATALVVLAAVMFKTSLFFSVIVGVSGVILLFPGLYYWRSNRKRFDAFDSALKLKISKLNYSDFQAIRQRQFEAQENLKVLKLRMIVVQDEWSSIARKLDQVVTLEPTWYSMTDAEIDRNIQEMTESCKQVFGEAGAHLIFQNQREVALL